ncbi:uncharacterized protein SPPG_06691 [Spizellomyces punctatus DAOM BR117]|uniref:Zn(2)-C6 fungal-type domain-containing protein n=1 Tax=Spizellomyces punctatus (strain DAOM BR117) TaxID=645134 RepID=A0A0L0H9R2_SPIPD|nr:uncharacterized protein SPPG_06691 [Spizellomyces punctatus DAOM BR117]KNC98295.1 hypothetical protein SPPG_06691 [Spizellomyces punctatus DAOM BR117]|eukprot:XP_016606335.1 hypothetical protein SPPG_06691 [Spizellomyces punctatus DAOM BR117]
MTDFAPLPHSTKRSVLLMSDGLPYSPMEGDSPGSGSPPHTDDSSKGSSHNKRKRTTKACDICNKRKVKCDGKQPACTQCLNGALTCSYAREAKKRGPKQGHLKELESRLKQMEALIRPLADKLPDAAAVLGTLSDSPSSASVPPTPDQSLPQQTMSIPMPMTAQTMFPPAQHMVTSSIGYPTANMANSSSPYSPYSSYGASINPAMQVNGQQLIAGTQLQQSSVPHQVSMGAIDTGPVNPYMNGFAYNSNPNVMPAMQVSTGLSPTLSLKPSPNISPSISASQNSEDEDIWNIIDRDFDELMGGGSFTPEKSLEHENGDFFTSLLGNGSVLPDGAGPGLGNVRQRRSIPRQLQVPFGEIPYAPSSEPPQFKSWPTEEKIPQEALDELLDLYFTYANPILGHQVHEKEFRRTIAAQSPLLLNAMYCVAARFSKHPSIRKNPEMMYQAGDVFYAKARLLISQTVDVPTLDTVSALIMLMTYASGSGRASASWMYSGMAIRMAQSLKMDLDPDFQEVQDVFGPMSWFEKERRRRLWWCCFLMDRYAAAAADRSMLCLERDVRVFAPVGVWVWETMSPDDEEPSGDSEGSHNKWQLTVLSSTGATPAQRPQESYQSDSPFDHYITLGKIFGRVMEYTGMLKSPTPSLPGTQVISMAEAEIRMAQLESALREWMAGLPPWMRNPGRTFAANWTRRTADGALSPPPWEVAYLHLFYNTAVVLLHRPKMMAILTQGPTVAMRSPHFLASQQSATAVATLLELIMSTNQELHWITPFVCFCIFQTALVHIVAAQTMRGDDMAVQAASQRVKTHLRALRLMSRCWLQGSKLAGILGDLFKSVESFTLMENVGNDAKAIADSGSGNSL